MLATTHRIHLSGSELAFDCEAGDTVLCAALRSSLGFPYECSAGGCGSCKFELVSGDMRELWSEAPGLRAGDRARSRRLACQSVPVSDCEIKVRLEPKFAPAITPRRFVATLTGVREVTHDMAEFKFRGEGIATFLPGQYALVSLGAESHRRAYSMSNLPNGDGTWKFMVRRVPGGRVSAMLFDRLRPGDTVEIDGPLGMAHWRPEVGRPIVCVGGGAGLAPLVSILDACLAARRPAWLFFGGRGPRDIPDIARLLNTREGLEVRTAVSVPALARDAAWPGAVCMVHELLARELPHAPAAGEYYLAGPPPMIEALVRLLLVDQRVPADQVHYDRFF